MTVHFYWTQDGQSTTTEYSFLCGMEKTETFKDLSLENPQGLEHGKQQHKEGKKGREK